MIVKEFVCLIPNHADLHKLSGFFIRCNTATHVVNSIHITFVIYFYDTLSNSLHVSLSYMQFPRMKKANLILPSRDSSA